MDRREARVGRKVLYCRTVAFGLSVAALAFTAGAAASQPVNNSLVPGIAPYSPPKAAAAPATAAAGPVSSKDAATASAGDAPKEGYDYVLGAGDKVRIIVYGEPDLTGEFFVAGNGDISFPLVGNIAASGQTLGKVRDEIVSSLKSGYIKDPRVSVEVLIFRPYYIFGEVAKPGEYPYSNSITVIDAVATAGGFTYRANSKYVLLKHAHDSRELKTRLTDELKIEPGDSVRIMQRYF